MVGIFTRTIIVGLWCNTFTFHSIVITTQQHVVNIDNMKCFIACNCGCIGTLMGFLRRRGLRCFCMLRDVYLGTFHLYKAFKEMTTF